MKSIQELIYRQRAGLVKESFIDNNEDLIKEEQIHEQWLLEEELLLESSTGEGADTAGKLRELKLGKHLNGNKHMESYRAEGKTPKEMHDKLATKAHGENHENTAGNKANEKDAKNGAEDIKKHLKKFGHGEVKRTVWTSQPSDHESETGVHDKNTKADLIVTTSKAHKRKNRNENKVAVSVKTGSGSVNYSNLGVDSLEKLSGAKLKHHTEEHGEVIKHNLSEDSHDKYKELRDSGDKKKQARAAKIKESSLKMNSNIAGGIREALAKKSHNELHKIVSDAVAPETHLKHIVSRQITYPKGHSKAGQEKSHHTYDAHKHVAEYLHHFENLHVDPSATGNSVTIHGHHKITKKKMAVARVSISAGGRPANKSPKGTVTLPSEDHKDIHYTDSSEHMEHHH